MMLNPTTVLTISYKVCFMTIVACVFGSALWAILPLFGWSYYKAEGLRMSCSVEWENHEANVLSYNITIFLLAFVVPVIVLIVANVKIIKTVSNSNSIQLVLDRFEINQIR